jgi:hypothetical protein
MDDYWKQGVQLNSGRFNRAREEYRDGQILRRDFEVSLQNIITALSDFTNELPNDVPVLVPPNGTGIEPKESKKWHLYSIGIVAVCVAVWIKGCKSDSPAKSEPAIPVPIKVDTGHSIAPVKPPSPPISKVKEVYVPAGAKVTQPAAPQPSAAKVAPSSKPASTTEAKLPPTEAKRTPPPIPNTASKDKTFNFIIAPADSKKKDDILENKLKKVLISKEGGTTITISYTKTGTMRRLKINGNESDFLETNIDSMALFINLNIK